MPTHKNAYAHYSNNRINTASKEELTLMLYDGALKFLNQAITSLEARDLAKSSELMIRVQEIIREFQLTLNRDIEISKNFDAMYDYMHRRLIEANMAKDKEILMEVRDLTRDFRDMWKQAMKSAREQATVAT